MFKWEPLRKVCMVYIWKSECHSSFNERGDKSQQLFLHLPMESKASGSKNHLIPKCPFPINKTCFYFLLSIYFNGIYFCSYLPFLCFLNRMWEKGLLWEPRCDRGHLFLEAFPMEVCREPQRVTLPSLCTYNWPDSIFLLSEQFIISGTLSVIGETKATKCLVSTTLNWWGCTQGAPIRGQLFTLKLQIRSCSFCELILGSP